MTALGNIKLSSFISNRLPLLNLPSDILEVLRSGKLETSKAKAITKIEDEQTRTELLSEAIEYNLSLNEIKQKIKATQQQSEPEPSHKKKVDDTLRRFKKSQVWDNPKKKAKVEKLLAQLENLMNTD
ncbi:Chromosome (plasmid) partitioning protein ParB / Stage 0 sporulation protein J [Richelia intracellularis]|nr:Chromosome (plasmid) partitioning protein ParB / Stage 0 sporulation protein J [Richelia intracellularis]